MLYQDKSTPTLHITGNKKVIACTKYLIIIYSKKIRCNPRSDPLANSRFPEILNKRRMTTLFMLKVMLWFSMLQLILILQAVMFDFTWTSHRSM